MEFGFRLMLLQQKWQLITSVYLFAWFIATRFARERPEKANQQTEEMPMHNRNKFSANNFWK